MNCHDALFCLVSRYLRVTFPFDETVDRSGFEFHLVGSSWCFVVLGQFKILHSLKAHRLHNSELNRVISLLVIFLVAFSCPHFPLVLDRRAFFHALDCLSTVHLLIYPMLRYFLQPVRRNRVLHFNSHLGLVPVSTASSTATRSRMPANEIFGFAITRKPERKISAVRTFSMWRYWGFDAGERWGSAQGLCTGVRYLRWWSLRPHIVLSSYSVFASTTRWLTHKVWWNRCDLHPLWIARGSYQYLVGAFVGVEAGIHLRVARPDGWWVSLSDCRMHPLGSYHS